MKIKKRILGSILVSALSIGLVGCSNNNGLEEWSYEDRKGLNKEENNYVQSVGSGVDTTDIIIGDYIVKIKDEYKIFTDWKGAQCVMFSAEFINSSNETVSFDNGVMAYAYQDGVQVNRTFDIATMGDSSSREIRPATSIDVNFGFEIFNTTSPVEIELEKFLSMDGDKITKTINLQ